MAEPRGRRVEWLIAEPPHTLPLTEAAEIGEGGFLTLPAIGRRLIDWLGDRVGVRLLADLGRPGCAVITPWQVYGDQVEALIGEIASNERASHEEQAHLALLRAQFLSLRTYEIGRIKLPNLILAEFINSPNPPHPCFVAFFADRVELHSVAFHREAMRQHAIDPTILGEHETGAPTT